MNTDVLNSEQQQWPNLDFSEVGEQSPTACGQLCEELSHNSQLPVQPDDVNGGEYESKTSGKTWPQQRAVCTVQSRSVLLVVRDGEKGNNACTCSTQQQ